MHLGVGDDDNSMNNNAFGEDQQHSEPGRAAGEHGQNGVSIAAT